MRAPLLAALVAALVLTACGGTGGSGAEGTATLWVTRDEGRTVMATAAVPAGLTVIQALDRVADVETRYGGRYVQAVDGVEGGLAARRDWFYFLNGIEPDRGAAEIRLRPGDVAWWDFRSWDGQMEQPVVVGAFPEPFLHGFSGTARPVEVEAPPGLAAQARELEAMLPGGGEGRPNRFVLRVDPAATGAVLTATRGQANDSPVTFVLEGSREAVAAAVAALVADPSIVRHRYVARFDDAGRVTG